MASLDLGTLLALLQKPAAATVNVAPAAAPSTPALDISSVIQALLPAIENPSVQALLLPIVEKFLANALQQHAAANPAPAAPVVVAPAAPAQPATPSAPVKFVPIPGKITLIGVRDSDTQQAVSAPYQDGAHFHLDLNLLNPAPWPEGEPKGSGVGPFLPEIVCFFDGVESDGSHFSAGSVDPDGYAGRANLMSLPDGNPHTGGVAFRFGTGALGPILNLPFQRAAVAYAPGYYRVELNGSKKVVTFYNGHKSNPPAGALPYSDQAAADSWLATKNPAVGEILKSPFTF